MHLHPKVQTSRTLRLATLQKKGITYAKELAIKNLNDLQTILEWNKENNIYFMRITSNLFPFCNHKEWKYSLDFADDLLKQIGNYAKEHKMRLSMHPGQYNVLSSNSQKVIDNTFRDLIHHCDILDRMGLNKDSIMVVHGGGVYGNKKKALERFKTNFLLLPKNVQKRLVIENCEMSYTIEDLLPLSEELLIPLVIDMHHDEINPSSENPEYYFERVTKIWKLRNIKQKIHISNSIPGIKTTDTKTARRKHSDYITYMHKSINLLEKPIDIMVEAKMKEKAIEILLTK